MISQAVALYLACFDGHKEVFVYNFSQYDDMNVIKQMAQVFKTYRGTKFYIVDQNNLCPAQWKSLSNVSFMTIRDWIFYCDI